MNNTVEINDQNFNNVIKLNKVVLVDFGASWCQPCRTISPIIDQLSNEYNGRAIIGKVDVDKNPILTSQFGIRNVPTILFFQNGQIVDKVGAGATKSYMQSKLNSLL